MHLKFLITYLLVTFGVIGLAQTTQEGERAVYEACKATQTPVEEYDCLSDYLKQFPQGRFRTQALRRLEELNNVPRNAFSKALEESERTRNCAPLDRFMQRYAYSRLLVQEAQTQKETICPPQTPCAGIRNFNNLYLKQCFEILRNPSADADCKEKARKRIWAIEDTVAQNMRCNNVDWYLRNFPNGRYRAKADSLLRLCADPGENTWQGMNKNSTAALRRFLENFPESRRAPDARRALYTIDERLWESAIQSNTINGFENYLKDFPDGKHVQEARVTLGYLLKDNESEEDTAFREALAKGSNKAMLNFLYAYPNTKYRSIALREIKRLSPPRHFIQKTGNTYLIEVQNLDNPRIADLSTLPDSLIVGMDYIDSNQIMIILPEEGVYPLLIEDDWNKRLPTALPTAPFSAEMTIRNDSAIIAIHNAQPPFNIEFRSLETGIPVRLEGIRDSLAKFSLPDLYNRHDLHGRYQVFVENDSTAYARIIIELEVPMPVWYWIGGVGSCVLLILAAFIARWQLRKRRIRRKMRALR